MDQTSHIPEFLATFPYSCLPKSLMSRFPHLFSNGVGRYLPLSPIVSRLGGQAGWSWGTAWSSVQHRAHVSDTSLTVTQTPLPPFQCPLEAPCLPPALETCITWAPRALQRSPCVQPLQPHHPEASSQMLPGCPRLVGVSVLSTGADKAAGSPDLLCPSPSSHLSLICPSQTDRASLGVGGPHPALRRNRHWL